MNGPGLLIKWRKARGFTQTQAAAHLELSQAALCEYERGRAVPRVDTAVRIERKTDGEVPVPSWVEAAE
jgi:transcriptional regulator with XRE-family HTH domain